MPLQNRAVTTCSLLLCAALASPAAAQWSDSAAANLAIGDRSGDQVQAKIRPTSDGGCYVSWFDNSTGGYDVYLQRLNAQGVEQWAHNGILIADRSVSSTEDYGLAVDAGNNAYLAFGDDRSGGLHTTVTKVTPDGLQPWGATGVQVTTTVNASNSPRITIASDGSIIAGWSQAGGARLQKLNARSGAPQWVAGGISDAPASGSYLLSDLQPGDDGSVIALYVKFTQRHLYTQKFSSAGVPLWNGGSALPIFDSLSVQFGYFPPFLPDGAGGAVFGWYAAGNNAFVQRVSSAGAELFAHNGVAASTNLTNRARISAAVAFDAVTGDIYLYWIDVTLPVQSMWGVFAQKISAAGVRQWTDSGVELVPFSSNQASFLQALVDDGESMGFWFDQAGPARVMGTRLNASGVPVWAGGGPPIEVCSVLSSKSRLSASVNSSGQALLAWGDGRNDGGDIFAQNVNADGTLGNVPRPADLNGDGVVGVADLLALIAAWGPCPSPPCAADIAPPPSGDGFITVGDLLALIADWG